MKSRMIYIFLMLLTLLAICIGIDMRRNNKIYSQGEDMLQCRNSELRSYTKDVFINGEKINNELQLFGEKLWFQAIKMTYPKTKLPPITCRGDQKWTKI